MPYQHPLKPTFQQISGNDRCRSVLLIVMIIWANLLQLPLYFSEQMIAKWSLTKIAIGIHRLFII